MLVGHRGHFLRIVGVIGRDQLYVMRRELFEIFVDDRAGVFGQIHGFPGLVTLMYQTDEKVFLVRLHHDVRDCVGGHGHAHFKVQQSAIELFEGGQDHSAVVKVKQDVLDVVGGVAGDVREINMEDLKF